MFIPPTPNGELRNRLSKIAKEIGRESINIGVIERAGKKIKSNVTRAGREN